MSEMEEQTQSLQTVASTHRLISGSNRVVKIVRAIIQSKLLLSGDNWEGNDNNGAHSVRANSVIANSESYGRSVAATECAMAAKRTMEERSYISTNIQSVVVTNSTMAATEDRIQSLRTIATTHGLITGNNGGENGGEKLFESIIQSKLLSISGGNWAGNDDNGANSGRPNLVVVRIST